jgi:arylsulfate sulfotransferase
MSTWIPANLLRLATSAMTAACLACWSAPAHAAVQITSLKASLKSPQPIGASVIWIVTATDSNPGPLTFQFNVAPPGGSLALAKDFNVGTLAAGAWTAQPFAWTPTGIEGVYQIQVAIKDFTSGETASKILKFQVSPLVTGSTPVVVQTANPLVALFSAPACGRASTMRVSFSTLAPQLAPAFTTNYMSCHPPNSMTFEIAGMYPNTTYQMYSQTVTGARTVNGSPVNFTTGALPANIPFPAFTAIVPVGPQTDTSSSVILHNQLQLGGATNYPEVATDLSGNILWYYYPNDSTRIEVLTRPLPNGTFLGIQSGLAWNPASQSEQLLRQVDLAGNILRETNTGVIQQELLAMGATDAQACNAVASPAPVGFACLSAFSHDFIQSLPNGYSAFLAGIEKIFPPGTQGDTSGLPVDIMGNMIVVLNTNWQVVWYWDAFQHDGGGTQLDINRAAVLGETCTSRQANCLPVFLLGPGIAPLANDWLHGNSLYYWPQDGDIIWSSRHQDWVMEVDYNNGTGTGNILWRMGPCGDFTFNNIYNDPWPWFSHQHDVGLENNGAGPLTLFDNGNTRVSPPTGPGSSTGCTPGLGSGNNRGMALTVDDVNMQVTPVLSVDLGVYAFAFGSAQLLSNGNYFYQPGTPTSYCIEILPTSGSPTGTQVLNLEGPSAYRAWQMTSLYNPPGT